MGSSVLVTLCCCSSVAGVVLDVDVNDVNSGGVNIVVEGINVVGDVGVVFSWSSKCRWDSLVIKSTSLKFNK